MVDKDLSFRSYADLQGLNNLKLQAKENDPEALKTVAKQFESLFLNMLMQNMRKANEGLSKDSYFESNQTRFYRDMLDQQLSLSLSSGKGVGISEMLVRQLSPNTGLDQDAPDPEKTSQIERRSFDQAMEATVRAAVEVAATTTKDNPEGLPELRPGDFVDAIKAAEAQVLQGRSGGRGSESSGSESGNTAASANADPIAATNSPQSFSTPAAFVEHIYPIATEAAGRLGVDPQVLVAQAALETGWGKYMPRNTDGSSSFNLFGIKADQRWSGEATLVDTLEFRDGIAMREKAAFRAYSSYQDSLQDYTDFIRSQPRYQGALDSVNDGSAYVEQLQMAGYATDPEYARKVSNILTGDVLQTALASIKDI